MKKANVVAGARLYVRPARFRVETRDMLEAVQQAHEEADQLYELAATKDPRLAMAIAHRLSSSIEGMRLALESRGREGAE